jgi:superfamily I DNA/RNA helicase
LDESVKWTDEQDSIFDWFENGAGNLVVRARAGSGKTTTIIEAISRAPERKILLAAFGKNIANELKDRTDKAEVKTLHALGNRFIQMNWKGAKVEGFERAENLTNKALGIDPKKAIDLPDHIISAVTNIHRKVRELSPYADTEDEVAEIAERFDLFPNEDLHRISLITRAALIAIKDARKEIRSNVYDYADMIFLPLTRGWVQRWFDLVVVDEAQDMSAPQLEIAMKACKRGGRIVLVGDDRQAIYGFRGADSGSLDRLKKVLSAQELRLSISFRCAKSIVRKARELVPDIEALEHADEGKVLECSVTTMKGSIEPGDFVLSRTRAPLSSICIELIISGTPAKIIGRDLGSDVKKLIKSFKAKTLLQVKQSAYEWEKARLERLNKRIKDADVLARKIEDVSDQRRLITSLCDSTDGDSVEDLLLLVDDLFDDKADTKEFVRVSTVHGAKGLEANSAYVIDNTFRRKLYNKESGEVEGYGEYREGDEEENIRYVAITRAKKQLLYLGRDADFIDGTPPRLKKVKKPIQLPRRIEAFGGR